MNKLRAILPHIPEFYFLIMAFLAAYTPPFTFNPFFLSFAVIIGLQLIFKPKTMGIIMGAAFLIINFMMGLAIISEASEMTTAGMDNTEMIAVGGLIWIANTICAISMIMKYAAGRSNRETITLSAQDA